MTDLGILTVLVKKIDIKKLCWSKMAAGFARGLMGDGSGSRRFVPRQWEETEGSSACMLPSFSWDVAGMCCLHELFPADLLLHVNDLAQKLARRGLWEFSLQKKRNAGWDGDDQHPTEKDSYIWITAVLPLGSSGFLYKYFY